MKMVNLTDFRFGRLVAKSFTHVGDKVFWRCVCDCGAECQIYGSRLRTGHTRSCGCLKRDALLARNTKHLLTGTPEHISWVSMRGRCLNKRNAAYADYGGRGISIDPRWSDFSAFLEDMGQRPSPSHTLDRIDNSKGYGPDNCRWASTLTQSNNTRRNRRITLNGVMRSCSEWERECGLKRGTLHHRLKAGWSVGRAILSPLRGS